MKHTTETTRKRPTRQLSKKAKKTKKPAQPTHGVSTFFERIAKDRRSAFLEIARMARQDEETPDELKTSFRKVRDDLGRHWDAVEHTLHSTLLNEENSNEIHAQVLEEKEYHHICDLLANELVQIPPSDPRWKAKFSLFAYLVAQYVEKSKDHLRSWKRELGPEETKLLNVRFERRISAQKASAKESERHESLH